MNYKLLIEFTDYIIVYPIRWYNFIKRVISKATFYYNTIIIPKNALTKHLKTFQDIITILENNNIITNKIENGDVIILYLKEKKYRHIFDRWLQIVVLRACSDLFNEVKCKKIFDEDFYIIVGDQKIGFKNKSDYHIIIGLENKKQKNRIIFSYNYHNLCQDLKNNINLQKYLKNV